MNTARSSPLLPSHRRRTVPAHTFPRHLQLENAEMRSAPDGGRHGSPLPSPGQTMETDPAWLPGQAPPAKSAPSASCSPRTTTGVTEQRKLHRPGCDQRREKYFPRPDTGRKSKGAERAKPRVAGLGIHNRENRQELATCRNTRCWLGVRARPEACGQVLGQQGLPAGERRGTEAVTSTPGAAALRSYRPGESRAPGARPAASPSGL